MIFSKKEKNMKIDWKNKFKERKDMIEIAISLFALLVSIGALLTSTHIQKKVADYEFLLSQTPNICFLNQEIQIPFSIKYDAEDTAVGGYKGIIDLTTTNDDFPIKIPVYNTGVGIAQNCKVIWSTQNQKDVALQCRDIFKYCGIEPYSDKSVFFKNAYSETYLKSFRYDLKDDYVLQIEPFYAKTIGEHYTFLDEDCIYVFPFILPISEEKNANYFKIPEDICAFLLESLHQEVITIDHADYQAVTMELCITYQDLNGKLYESNCEIKFTPLNIAISLIEPMMRVQLEITMN